MSFYFDLSSKTLGQNYLHNLHNCKITKAGSTLLFVSQKNYIQNNSCLACKLVSFPPYLPYADLSDK